MAEGILIEVEDGFAHIQFLDASKRGPALAKLLAIGGPELIETDSRSNPRKTYIVPEGMARDAGLLDDSEPEDKPLGVDFPETEPNDSWTVPQLRSYAKLHEIDLGAATKKADILAAVTAPSPPEPGIIAPAPAGS